MIADNLKSVFRYLWNDPFSDPKEIFVFTDTLCGSGIEGLENFIIRQGDDVVSTVTGKSLQLPNVEITLGTERAIQLRTYEFNSTGAVIDDTVILSNLFPQKDVLFMTSGTYLQGFAPVFNDKQELDDWINDLKEWRQTIHAERLWYCSGKIEDMIRLTEFLHQNQPEGGYPLSFSKQN